MEMDGEENLKSSCLYKVECKKSRNSSSKFTTSDWHYMQDVQEVKMKFIKYKQKSEEYASKQLLISTKIIDPEIDDIISDIIKEEYLGDNDIMVTTSNCDYEQEVAHGIKIENIESGHTNRFEENVSEHLLNSSKSIDSDADNILSDIIIKTELQDEEEMVTTSDCDYKQEVDEEMKMENITREQPQTFEENNSGQLLLSTKIIDSETDDIISSIIKEESENEPEVEQELTVDIDSIHQTYDKIFSKQLDTSTKPALEIEDMMLLKKVQMQKKTIKRLHETVRRLKKKSKDLESLIDKFRNNDKTIVNTELQVKVQYSSIKEHECSTCKKKFGTVSNLNRHKQLHSANQKYTCTICNKAFSHSGNYKIHMRIHL